MAKDPTAQDARHAAENEPDIGVEHVATVYGQALLDTAEKAGRVDAVLEEFDSLVGDVLEKFPKFESLLGSALISHEEKEGILDRTIGGLASPLLVNFLKVVSRHGRLDCLRAIHRRTRELHDRMCGRVPVTVSTATEVDRDMADRITEHLRGLLDGEPKLEQIVDPELIGGLVVQVGDTVYDGSIATQLKNTRQQMIDRSVHEIQSRRDRFRYPTGD